MMTQATGLLPSMQDTCIEFLARTFGVSPDYSGHVENEPTSWWETSWSEFLAPSFGVSPDQRGHLKSEPAHRRSFSIIFSLVSQLINEKPSNMDDPVNWVMCNLGIPWVRNLRTFQDGWGRGLEGMITLQILVQVMFPCCLPTLRD